jgi:type II secretory pathway predicted ATPase ExeA
LHTSAATNGEGIELMLREVMGYYGITRDFPDAGYFETEHLRRVSRELDAAIRRGGLIALCSIVGCGKTTLLTHIRQALQQEGEILISRSLALDKVNIKSLITALLYDLTVDDDVKIPVQTQRRERLLLWLIERRARPVALFADDAHRLENQTLVELKRLIELVHGTGETLSVVLAGHPKLKNTMDDPRLEEIGEPCTIFTLEGTSGKQEAYIRWLLQQCATQETEALIQEEAIALVAEHLTTPLQIAHYLTLAFEQAYVIAEKPVSAALVDSVLPPGLNDPQAWLARQGYNAGS